MQNKIDIYLFSERKLDETILNQQFKNHGYKMYHRDRNKHGGGVLYYVNENIPSKVVSVEGVSNDCEIILIEFSIKTQKWLYIGLTYTFQSKSTLYSCLNVKELFAQNRREI